MKDQTTKRPFRRPDILRPPSEWRSYYLPLTSGCSNNTCAFCSYYGSGLQVRDAEEVEREIDALALFAQKGVTIPSMPDIVYAIAQGWDGKRLFLQDGDALVYPYPELVRVLRYLNERMPWLERIASYATPRDILRRSVDELRQLKDQKLGILYMGIESGDDEVLTAIRKNATAAQIVEAGRKVKEAGITLSVTVILGLAGLEGSEQHALKTAQILSDIDPEFAGALTLTLVPGTPMHDLVRRGEFQLVSPFDSLTELRTIVENAQFSSCFFSSMHASNYVSIRGNLPHEKGQMLSALNEVLARKDPEMLRPEYLRGL